MNTAITDAIAKADNEAVQRGERWVPFAPADDRPILVATIASRMRRSYQLWESGVAASPSALDHARDASFICRETYGVELEADSIVGPIDNACIDGLTVTQVAAVALVAAEIAYDQEVS